MDRRAMIRATTAGAAISLIRVPPEAAGSPASDTAPKQCPVDSSPIGG